MKIAIKEIHQNSAYRPEKIFEQSENRLFNRFLILGTFCNLVTNSTEKDRRCVSVRRLSRTSPDKESSGYSWSKGEFYTLTLDHLRVVHSQAIFIFAINVGKDRIRNRTTQDFAR